MIAEGTPGRLRDFQPLVWEAAPVRVPAEAGSTVADDIQVGGVSHESEQRTPARLVEVEVGSATIFIESADEAEIEPSDAIHPVRMPSPKQAFERTADFLQECVGIFDSRIAALVNRPEEISVEFSLAFQVAGKATLVPVLLSGKASTQAALKVTARWETGTAQSDSAGT